MTTKYSHTKAEQYCGSMGAILATPRTAGEDECAWSAPAATGYHSYFWLGYRGGQTQESVVGVDGETAG